MKNIKISCTDQYRYSKGFDSCLFLHGEPLRLTLLICATSIFALLILLFLMLIGAKKLLPKLIKEKQATVHLVGNHNVQKSIKSYSNSRRKNQYSSSDISESQLRSEESDTNS